MELPRAAETPVSPAGTQALSGHLGHHDCGREEQALESHIERSVSSSAASKPVMFSGTSCLASGTLCVPSSNSAPWWGTAPALRKHNLAREKTWGQILTIQQRHHMQATDTARTGRLRGFDGNQRLGAWGAKLRESFPRKLRVAPELGQAMRRSRPGDWGQNQHYKGLEQQVGSHSVLTLPRRPRNHKTVGKLKHGVQVQSDAAAPSHGAFSPARSLGFFPMADRPTSEHIPPTQV